MNCYVLVGGRSTRMGRSKAELFLDRIVAAAAPVFERVIAVERHGMPEHGIETIFEERHDGEAPAFGVARALADATGPCFILAVDFAAITSGVLSWLRSRFEVSNAGMMVPVWDGVPQVLCAGYRTCIVPRLAERLANEVYDLQGLLDDADVEMIDEKTMRQRFGGEPLLNVNTPSELENVERIR